MGRNIERAVEVGWSQESAERRAGNRDSSAAVLAERGITFESKNSGVHLIVTHGEKVADFWPGTGKYIVRGGRQGRGVFNLLKAIGFKENANG
jgi:hypothetical protein